MTGSNHDVLLEVDGLSFGRGVTSFRLEVPTLRLCTGTHGNKIPIMGRSGAGKSTLLNLLGAVEWAGSGAIRWHAGCGEGPLSWERRPAPQVERDLRGSYFGYAFQSHTLLPHMTVEKNLVYPLRVRGWNAAKARSRALEKLDAVLIKPEERVDEYRLRYPHQLSGGQRQRISVAQAFVHDPVVLLADEPTGCLDQKTRGEIMAALLAWADEDKRRLLLWVTHFKEDLGLPGVRGRLQVEVGENGVSGCLWQERKVAEAHDDRL